MKPIQIMLIAGETSGDLLAAELVVALRKELIAREISYTPDLQPLKTGLEPRFFGAGGPQMKAAGVELAFDLTQYAVTGISDVLKKYVPLRRCFHELRRLAISRQPDAVIGIDYGGFNLRFGHAIRKYVRSRSDWFHTWQPKIVQYVSPQVWGSRPGRAYRIARDYDLLLSLFPFEKSWYARRVPELRVEFVGHPMIDRFANYDRGASSRASDATLADRHKPNILLLPGSRTGELTRHLPVLFNALTLIRRQLPEVRAKMVLPNESLAQIARSLGAAPDVEIQIGPLPEALAQADLAIASTGTVTMECAYFGVPTVAIYKTSWVTYRYAKQIATVSSLTMPNLMAGAEVFPEFIQHAATPEHISRAALDLLQNESQRARIKKQLTEVIDALGGPGATARAARAIVQLLKSTPH
jgi:lipid-A-disaccharide synthase